MKNTILISLLTTSLLYSSTITGVGFGDQTKEAKKEALADLSNKISVDVKSHFKTITQSSSNNYDKKNINIIDISSNLPLKGVQYDTLVKDKIIKITATINSNKALGIYEKELIILKANIADSLLSLKTTKNDNLKFTILNQLLKDIKNFKNHKTVALLLGGKKLPTLKITKNYIENKIKQYQLSIPTIKIASQIATKDITQTNIYLSAIKPNGSNDITQFAKLLKNDMSTHLKITKYSKNADYFLRGSYEILKNSISIILNLSDKNNNILKTTTILLNKKAYQNIKYKPTTKTFDNAINSEFVKSGKLYVNIGFKGFNRADSIDLNKGDVVDIVVKTNKPICYFLVGHTLNNNDKFSYLLSQDNLTGADVNRYITILEDIPIDAPYGSETLQIFASTFPKNGKCPLKPPVCKENDDGYCVIRGTPQDVVVSTRGLNISKKKVKIQKAEAYINWTSFK